MFSKISNITYLKNDPLCNHSSFKIGGNCKHFIYAHTIDALLDALYLCKKHSIPHKVIGGGSNLLFDDLGYNGVIIVYDNFFKQIKDDTLYASSGCDLNLLIQYIIQHDLGGLEFCVGVPAKLGGAIVNNLGAYNNEIATFIDRVTVLRNNQLIYLNKDECQFKYHTSIFQNSGDIILASTFKLPGQNQQISKGKLLEYINNRKSSQPLNSPNAGSIFKKEVINHSSSPTHAPPSKLIDSLGLKGLQVGNCQISTKHAGFIVNLGNGKSKDVLSLIKIIQDKVFEHYKVELQLEIEHVKSNN